MARNPLLLGVLVGALLALAGCGQKGPLYLPGDSESAETYDPQNAYEDAPQSTQDPRTESRTEEERNTAAPAPQASPMPDDAQPANPQPDSEDTP
nr:lipoprotein [Salinicola sp. S1-1-2]